MNRLEKVKKLNVVLQYMPAVIVFFFALSLWRAGNNESAVILGLIGIGLMLLAVLLNVIRKIVDNDRRFIIVLATVVFCSSLYIWIKGEIYYGLISTLTGIFMILGSLLYSQKDKGSRWSSPTWQIYIPIVVGLITFGPLLYLQYKKNNTHTVGGVVGLQPKNIERSSRPNQVPKEKTSAALVSARMQKMVDIMNQSLTSEQRQNAAYQKLMEIMASESFQQQLERQNPKTPQEILQIFAQHGLTEAKDIDFDKILAEHQKRQEAAYSAKNPDKDPADEDDAMVDRLAQSIKKHGSIGGMTKFMMNPDNVEWMGIRFKNDIEAYNAWMDQVRFHIERGAVARSTPTSESGNVAKPSPVPRNLDLTNPLQKDILASEKTAQDPFVELEDSIPHSPDSREVTPPVVEPEKVISQVSPQPPALPISEELETTLRDRFSSERFERAMDTLDRYGEEEGLRRLRESDPEIARQMEQRRDRKDKESAPSRRGEHE